uniref:Uncharacterized protein n=1 Tax=Glossina austeni TaxID=7395 RepID=A0A1A9UXI4_GLOAU
MKFPYFETLNEHHIRTDAGGVEYKNLIFFITGNDGDMLKNHIKRLVAKKAVKVVYALIGIVARLVSNSTLHSTLKLLARKDEKIAHMPVRKYNSISTIRLRQWEEIEFLFVKEISLAVYEMVCKRGEFSELNPSHIIWRLDAIIPAVERRLHR